MLARVIARNNTNYGMRNLIETRTVALATDRANSKCKYNEYFFINKKLYIINK